jgi:hypothetical protein
MSVLDGVPGHTSAPTTARLVTDDDAAGGQHLLDHAQAQRETEIEPDRVADDRGREPVTGNRYSRKVRTVTCARLFGPALPSKASNLMVPNTIGWSPAIATGHALRSGLTNSRRGTWPA